MSKKSVEKLKVPVAQKINAKLSPEEKVTAATAASTPSKKPKAAKKQTPKKKKIMFVCTGNTCRSPMAEFIFKSWLKDNGLQNEYDVCSSGIEAQVGEEMALNACLALDSLNIKYEKRKAVQTTDKLVGQSDLIICMTKNHKAAFFTPKAVTIAEICGLSDCADPFGYDLPVYVKTAEYLIYASAEIIPFLQKHLKS